MAKQVSKSIVIGVTAPKPTTSYIVTPEGRKADPNANGWSQDVTKSHVPHFENTFKAIMTDAKADAATVILMGAAGAELSAAAAALKMGLQLVIVQPYATKVGKKTGGPEIHWDTDTQARYNATLARATVDTVSPRVEDDKAAEQAVAEAARRIGAQSNYLIAFEAVGADAARVYVTMGSAYRAGAKLMDVAGLADAFWPAAPTTAAAKTAAPTVDLW